MTSPITIGSTVRLAPTTKSPHPAWKLRVGREYLIVDRTGDEGASETENEWLAWVPRSHTDDPCAGDVITLHARSVTVVAPAPSADARLA